MNPPTAYNMEQIQKALDAALARAEKAEAEIQQANEYLDQGWCPQTEADAQGGAPDGMTRLAWRLHLSLRGALSGPEADALCARAKKAEGGMAALREIAKRIPPDLEIESVKNRDLSYDEFYLFAASGEVHEDSDELGINRWDETCREAGKAIIQLVKQIAALDAERNP